MFKKSPAQNSREEGIHYIIQKMLKSDCLSWNLGGAINAKKRRKEFRKKYLQLQDYTQLTDSL